MSKVIHQSPRYGPVRFINKQATYGQAMNSATAAWPSSAVTSGTGRQVFIGFAPIRLPSACQIVGFGFIQTNSTTADVYYPRFKVDFYNSDVTNGGPSTRVDANYTPGILGPGAIQATADVAPFNNWTYYRGNGLSAGSNRQVVFQFTEPCIVPYSQSDLQIFVGLMVENTCTSDATGKVPVSATNTYGNNGLKWRNSSITAFANPGEMGYTPTVALSKDITTQAFPTNPQSLANTEFSQATLWAPATTFTGLGFDLLIRPML